MHGAELAFVCCLRGAIACTEVCLLAALCPGSLQGAMLSPVAYQLEAGLSATWPALGEALSLPCCDAAGCCASFPRGKASPYAIGMSRDCETGQLEISYCCLLQSHLQEEP